MWSHDKGLAVFEIKGAPGARGAHFRRRAHTFRQCALDVRTFSLENKLILIHVGTGKVTGRTVVKSLHPLSAENKKLDFKH